MPTHRSLLLACLLCCPPLWSALAKQPSVVEVSHWWVSEGERASIDVIRHHTEAKGLAWHETVFAG